MRNLLKVWHARELSGISQVCGILRLLFERGFSRELQNLEERKTAPSVDGAD
jgi:hypothetical protein